jgi:hypothetical protein
MGGGHHAMARVAYRLQPGHGLSDDPGDPATVNVLMDRVVAGVEALRAVR